jgi:ribonucleoside-diphosphate reductase alpha chain
MSSINVFKTEIANNVFYLKFAFGHSDTWDNLSRRVVADVCGRGSAGTLQPLLSTSEQDELYNYISTMRFIPGGRYLYYAGRDLHAFNNCFLLKAEEDTREEWSNLIWRANSCLMLGGGIGVDYSVVRPRGRTLKRTGGLSSGPIPLMQMINEIGRNVMQGGSRRSAIYASLNWQHEDIEDFLTLKNWHDIPVATGVSLSDVRNSNPDFPAPMDTSNISVNYDDDWLNDKDRHLNPLFLDNCRQALHTGEPGFSFNFGDKSNETLRNACTEVTSADDSDVCNLGSVNMGAIETLEEFTDIVRLGSKFLVCGTVRADLPYDKVREVRESNRRLGLGLMGIHEWLLKRGSGYEVTKELHKWLEVYRDESVKAADEHCERLYLSKPCAYRAIAPTGTISTIASTSSGIEPLFSVAFKRRYLVKGSKWHYEYVIDPRAELMINELGVKEDDIETSYSLAENYEKRIKFQADIQDYVDMGISSTINIKNPKQISEGKIQGFAETLSKYAPRLRGLTVYPDGSRGGQPLTEIPYEDAIKHKGVVYEEVDVCDLTGKGGSCG